MTYNYYISYHYMTKSPTAYKQKFGYGCALLPHHREIQDMNDIQELIGMVKKYDDYFYKKDHIVILNWKLMGTKEVG